MPRVRFPDKAEALFNEFSPYIDYTDIECPFKPGTPECIKAKKAEWKRIVEPLYKEAQELSSCP